MTVEERAKKAFDAFMNVHYMDLSDEMVMNAITQALRDQIEECAKVIDGKIEDWKHSMKTIKHFTGTYEEIELMEDMAEAIRALAGPISTPTEEGKESER